MFRLWNDKEKRLEEIKRQQPFRNVLIIRDAIALDTLRGHSGQSFKVISNTGKPFKLRYCFTLRVARSIERNINIFPNAFPRFYGREGRYLLFDWINGTDLLTKEISLSEAYQIGKLLGEINEGGEKVNDRKLRAFYQICFKEIREEKIFDNEIINKIEALFLDLMKRLDIDIILDIQDTHPKNFVVDNHSKKVFYVDEEGLTHGVKGTGINTFLQHFLKNDSAKKEAFWKGYNEHHSNDYFDRDYRKLTIILQNIRMIYVKSKNGKKIDSWLTDQLIKLVRSG